FGSDRQRLQLTGANVGGCRGQVIESEVDFAGQQSQLSGRTTAVRHVYDVDAGLIAEELTCQVTTTAVTAGAVVQHTGVGLAEVDQILHRIDVVFFGQFGVHDQHVGHVHHQRDGVEIVSGVKRKLFEDPGVYRLGSQGC